MGSITRTQLVKGSEPIEVPSQQTQKPIEKKSPVSQRGGRKGGFIAVDGLLGDDKK